MKKRISKGTANTISWQKHNMVELHSLFSRKLVLFDHGPLGHQKQWDLFDHGQIWEWMCSEETSLLLTNTCIICSTFNRTLKSKQCENTWKDITITLQSNQHETWRIGTQKVQAECRCKNPASKENVGRCNELGSAYRRLSLHCQAHRISLNQEWYPWVRLSKTDSLDPVPSRKYNLQNWVMSALKKVL